VVRSPKLVFSVHSNQLAVDSSGRIHIMMSQLLSLHRIRSPQTLLKFLPTVRQLTASTAGETTLTADDPAEHLPHTDPHCGPLDAPDEPPEIIIIEAQHAQQEPPSQKPPMWFIQVGASPFNADSKARKVRSCA
jgi:hypothetical protein